MSSVLVLPAVDSSSGVAVLVPASGASSAWHSTAAGGDRGAESSLCMYM